MAKKVKPGVYNKRVNGKMRRVRILKNGQWRFLKGSPTTTKSKSRTTTKKRTSTKNPTISKGEARGKARYVKIKGRYHRVRK